MKKTILGILLLCSVSVWADETSPIVVSSIAAGALHSCALTTAGAVKCWGSNAEGQLGDNSTTGRLIPVDVESLGSSVIAITAGASHSCALTTAGGVKCWGSNADGQLGDNSTSQRLTAVDVDGLGSGVMAITAGAYHSCALTAEGGVKCWGRNDNGQLGDNSTTQRLIAVDVSGLGSGVAAIMAGHRHSCALTMAGAMKCWGSNAEGQLGDNSTIQRLTAVDVSSLNSGVMAITAGAYHSCALTTAGALKCWGYNGYGQLGDNSTTNRLAPVAVSSLGSGVTAIAIAAGDYYSCALTAAGGVKCWGYNVYGRLGDSSTTNRLVPVNVSGLKSGVMALTAGWGHTCALTTAGGVKCWGYNNDGQLGDNSTTVRLTPVYVNDLIGDSDRDGVVETLDNCPLHSNTSQYDADGDTQGNACDETPYQPINIVDIAAGGNHTCALTAESGVKCWGDNDDGQVGDNSRTIRLTPVDVSNLGSGVTAIATGYRHSCALTAAGGMKCWGDNSYGQLGDNSFTRRLTPVDVSGLGSGVTAIAAWGGHTCALTTAGGVKCWGYNYDGELGDNSTTIRQIPVDVSGLGSGVMAITTGGSHSCALTTAGGVKCWGKNHNGQLGDNSTTQRLTPVDVSGLSSGVMAIEAGSSSTCALTAAGAVKCWGKNGAGTSTLTPTDVSGLGSGVMAITVGGSHSCALTTAGGVKCWGWNNYGQMGDNSTTTGPTLIDVSGLGSGVMAITAGGSYTCALTTAGGVECWGYNGYGQLGDNSTTNRLTPVYVTGLIGDSDDDGVADSVDNCPLHANQDQVNTDAAADGGDVCDSDDDNDGMPDAWEITYGFNPLVNDASVDADNDGLTNLQEYNNGSNPIAVRTKNDYNNDGIAGWIWKGQSNGVETESQIWQLTLPLQSPNFSAPVRSYPPIFPDQANWDIVTSGDFNKDGDADMLWRNNNTAEWKIWQMQNGTRAAQSSPADFDLAHEWQVIGAGDTDNDGDDDVIFNNSTGEVLVWEMQSHVVAATHNVGSKAGYTLSRIGDFNKDGDVDLLFRQNGGDALITWELQANTFVQERALANTGTGYNPVCAGDFDGDGDDDIMLVHSGVSKQEKWFVMESYVRSQQFGGTNDGFVFLGCGDYDGDGDADSLWQRSLDDLNRAVLQQNWGASKQTVYTNPFGGVNPEKAGYGFVYRGNSN